MATTKTIFIYGASGHGKVIAEIIESCGYKLGGWIDDRILDNASSWDSFRSVYSDAKIALGVGDNIIRERLYRKITDAGYSLPVLVHPSAVVSPSAILGEATIVMPLVVINANVSIGDGCIINSGSIIEHDCTIEDFSHISPKAALAGGVRIGHHVHIGIGSSIIQNITIGEHAIIGAGAAVTRDISSHSTCVGVPAKTIKRSL